jgi:hypothetical protein
MQQKIGDVIPPVTGHLKLNFVAQPVVEEIRKPNSTVSEEEKTTPAQTTKRLQAKITLVAPDAHAKPTRQ